MSIDERRKSDYKALRDSLFVADWYFNRSQLIADHFASIDRMEAKENEWIKALQAQGIKAAHPDDGWVNRAENYITLCYPSFDDGLEVGSKLVLGSSLRDKYRVVEITRADHIWVGLTHWYFKPVQEPKRPSRFSVALDWIRRRLASIELAESA
jgi:hypothetical protein